MAKTIFPSAPSIGDTFLVEDVNWKYNGFGWEVVGDDILNAWTLDGTNIRRNSKVLIGNSTSFGTTDEQLVLRNSTGISGLSIISDISGWLMGTGSIDSSLSSTSLYIKLLGGINMLTLTDTGTLGINITQPDTNAKVDINGQIKIRGGSPTIGKILTSDSTGLGSWENIKLIDNTDAPSSTNVGSLRYRKDGNNSYVDIVMETGIDTYEWINIVQNNW